MSLTYETFLNKAMTDIAVATGLLHDVGMVLAEESRVSHEELGGYYLKWQGMPDSIVEGALFHHNPLEASEENKEMIGVLHLANYYADSFLGKRDGALDERAFEILKINRERYEECLQSALSTWHVEQWH
jgi:HD-like signal output (HDOD) protein